MYLRLLLPALCLMAGCASPPPTPVMPPPLSAPNQPTPDVVEPEPQTMEKGARPKHAPDARPFAGHWYKAFDEDISWHDARARCEAMGGTLACIETAAEQAFIAALAKERYLYLGATDENEEGTWRWINGVAWSYTAWMDGQPNNYGEEEHYLATYDGGEWVDVAAEGEGFWMPTGFICEWSGE